MGIQDRDYYRDDGRSYLGSLVHGHPVTAWLVAINIGVFLFQLFARGSGVSPDGDRRGFDDLFVLQPDLVFFQGQVWRLFTCAFLHADLGHILFNLLFLWWFGSEVETIYGSPEFAALYFGSVLASSLAFCAAAASGMAGTTLSSTALGASGAVSAVMLVFACHYPYHRLLLFFFIPVPVWLLVAFQVLRDVSGLMGPGTGVAVAAHLGGAAFGLAYWLGGWRILNWLPGLPRLGRARPRLRVYRDAKPAPVPVPVSAPRDADPSEIDEQLEAKLDQVLAKVAEQGQASLTDGERQILFRASEIYKRRRGR
jgi:membrane associated rhomboid family serine protease